jgi:hypothetical protein
MSKPKRFRCPACKKVLDRLRVHGNRKTLKSFCVKTDRDVVLTRLVYRKG